MRTVLSRASVAFVAALLLSVAPASAAAISLSTPLSGTTTNVDFVDLLVSYDANGSPAPNLVGVELYVAFTGLVPVTGSLDYLGSGSVFGPFSSDTFAIDGVCFDVGPCNYPPADQFSPSHDLVQIGVFAPAQPTGPGTLFTLRFTPDGTSSAWTLNLFGEEGVALLSDPCDPADASCVAVPDPIAFVVVPPSANVSAGTARLDVSARSVASDPQTVPEPATVLLTGLGLAALARRRRR